MTPNYSRQIKLELKKWKETLPRVYNYLSSRERVPARMIQSLKVKRCGLARGHSRTERTEFVCFDSIFPPPELNTRTHSYTLTPNHRLSHPFKNKHGEAN